MNNAKVTVRFVCPFCGKNAAAIEPAGVLHDFPPCTKFVEMEVVEYLAAVNAANGGMIQ